jgi:hypothetical protein
VIKLSDLPPETLARMKLKPEAATTATTKYKVKAKDTRTTDGITFDSKAEMHRYRDLLSLKANGIIAYFLRQVPFHLPGNVVYRCDFMVVYPDGRIEFEDVKGFRTPMYVLKRKQVQALYPITIKEISTR